MTTYKRSVCSAIFVEPCKRNEAAALVLPSQINFENISFFLRREPLRYTGRFSATTIIVCVALRGTRVRKLDRLGHRRASAVLKLDRSDLSRRQAFA